MFAFLKRKFGKTPDAHGLYLAVVEQARTPVFYELYSVPDTVDGRFDLICLHAFLVVDRLQAEGKAGRALAQSLFDTMFLDMDRTLREMGVGDLGIPKHIKRMMKGFNGRATAFYEALMAEGNEELTEALRRNLYSKVEDGGGNNAALMALYMRECKTHLALQPFEAFLKGNIEFMAIEYEGGNEQEHPSRMVA